MSVDEDLGTVRWFGETWLAPICDPRAHVPTPVGQRCLDCRVTIEQGDRGVTIPYGRSRSGKYPVEDGDWLVTTEPHHLACCLSSTGIEAVAERVSHRPLTLVLALDLRPTGWSVA